MHTYLSRHLSEEPVQGKATHRLAKQNKESSADSPDFRSPRVDESFTLALP